MNPFKKDSSSGFIIIFITLRISGVIVVERHENGYFLDKKVDTSIRFIVLGQESGYFL